MFTSRASRGGGHGQYKYQRVATVDERPSLEEQSDSGIVELEGDQPSHPDTPNKLQTLKRLFRRKVVIIIMSALTLILFLYWAFFSKNGVFASSSCDTVEAGFTCQPHISHFWGQYSPFFSVPSELPSSVPAECNVTFVQVLSRHGARDPTSSKTAKYNATIQRIQSSATSYSKSYAFLKDFEYTLGADQLTVFGQQQMVNSGQKFYTRYHELTEKNIPFFRSSGEARVVESALNFTQGFHQAKLADKSADSTYPYNIVTISEDAGSNNTLSHDLCTDFEDFSTTGDDAQLIYQDIFVPPITARINKNIPGVNITATETIYLMDLCPFTTVANVNGTIGPFCSLFTEDEWKQYDYYQSLGKFYGYGWGNSLGPTQGVGFTNELIARLTNSAVNDHTSTNHTLDDNPATFPVGGSTIMYADFSHDNDMTAIFAALGLYNSTQQLLNTTLETAQEMKGYSASWTVSFGARVYVEKMFCEGEAEELVRVVVNDRVVPLTTCAADRFGRCGLGAFVDSLSFAQAGGHWDQCFISET